MDRLQRQIQFIKEIDKLKSVYRRSYLFSRNRKENSAEHSWHVAAMAMLLSEHADREINLLRVLQMLLVHDIVEIDAGDTFCYDEEGSLSKYAREKKAAERIFGQLPEDQRKKVFELWKEYEAEETDDARFAVAMDRLMPILHNLGTEGKAWRENRIVKDQVLDHNSRIGNGSIKIWGYIKTKIMEAVKKGILPESYEE